MLLAQVLDAGEVAAVVVRGDEQLPLLDPGLLVRNVPEELLECVTLVEEALSSGRQVMDVLVSISNKISNKWKKKKLRLTFFNIILTVKSI